MTGDQLARPDVASGELVPVQHVRAVPVPHSPAAPESVWSAIDREVDAATEEAIQAGVPANTRRAYARWVRDAEEWCEDRGRVALPMTAETLASYIADVKGNGLGVSSLRQAIAAVRSHHALSGYPEQPPAHLARIIARGHARELAARGVRVHQAPPLLRDDLHRMIDVCDPDTLRGRQDRLLLAVGFGGLLRRSEIVGLHARDVRPVRPPGEGVELFIAASKTDKLSEGVTVTVDPVAEHLHDPRSDIALALAAYREARAAAGLGWDGPLLRTIGIGGRVLGPMTGDAVNDLVKDLAGRAGLAEAELYSAHSLRAGGATQMYLDGWLLDQIIERGRWAPGSTVVLGYIRSVSSARRAQMRRAAEP